jgi:Flp pilus assembly protein TadD
MAQHANLAPPGRSARGLVAAAIVLLTAWVYAGVPDHAFVDFDDPEYVVANPHLDGRISLDDVARAFAEPYNSNWSPLTSLSLALGDAIHGPDPGGYAATNAALHALASVLLFAAFGALTARWRASALLAAVFAVHPLHVESVAWISERKDVLAGVFWMAALAAHARAVRMETLGAHALVFGLGVLALLSKPTAVALPITLLLVDFWPLDRLRRPADRRRALLEKAPLVVAAVAVSAITYAVQTAAGANATAQTPLPARLLNAARAYAIYVLETLWPVDLAYFHPFPSAAELASGSTLAALAAVAGVTILAFAAARRHPAFTMGWLWFLLTLVPMIGIVRVGGQAHADRYVYVAQTGLVAILVFAGPDALAARFGSPRRRRLGDLAAMGMGLAAVLILAALARQQVAVWHDSIALFGHATRVTRENAHAHRFLGVSLWSAGDREGGARHLQEALRIRPDWGEARLVWATALLQLGRFEAARPEIERAAREGADPALVWAARGVLADGLGDRAAAASAYERSLERAPEAWEVLNNLAWIRAASPEAELRDPERAVALARRAADERPDHAFVLGTLAAAYASAGREGDAVAAQSRACALLRAAGDEPRAREFEARLAAYRAGRPPWQSLESAP